LRGKTHNHTKPKKYEIKFIMVCHCCMSATIISCFL